MSWRLVESFGTTEELAELFADGSVLSALLAFEAALALAQAKLGMIPASAAEVLARIEPGSFDAASIAREARAHASIAVPFVKALTEEVRRTDAGAAGFVHWGATSQDAIDTALVLLLRRAREVLARDQERLEGRLRSLCDEHAGTVMLARTLLQPAPPITFGYKVAGWYGSVRRSWKRLARSFEEGLRLQFGGAAGTLAAYGERGPALAEALGRELGLALPEAPWHAHRERLAAVVADCGIYAGSLAKIARDVALLMQGEVGEVAERGGGSSAMPNKRNPAGSAVALAAAERVPGLVAAFLTGMAQEHERAAGGWQAEWPLVSGTIQGTGSTLAAVAETLDGLEVRPERMRANLAATCGAVFAEKAAMLLAERLGRSAAQAAVAEALERYTLREGLARLLTPEELEKIDRPEDYLGATETFRRRLLQDQE